MMAMTTKSSISVKARLHRMASALRKWFSSSTNMEDLAFVSGANSITPGDDVSSMNATGAAGLCAGSENTTVLLSAGKHTK